jgi:hypothetical protein
VKEVNVKADPIIESSDSNVAVNTGSRIIVMDGLLYVAENSVPSEPTGKDVYDPVSATI